MRFLATVDSRPFSIQDIDPANGTAKIDGRVVRFDLRPVRPGVYSLIVDNRVYTVRVTRGNEADEISIGPYHASVMVEDERAALLRKLAHTQEDTGPLEITSPIPGLVVRLFAAIGDHVKKGQRLVTIEAMKMENEIKSPADGMVTEVSVRERDVVEKDARLVQIRKI